MASRRRAREFALQALYDADITQQPGGAALRTLWSGMLDGEGLPGDDKAPESEEIEFAQRLVAGVDARKAEIDALIESCSTNWRLPRMPVVDRNVLRLAAFELLACPDIPATVSINEAVELAKRFGTGESKAFVNGICDRLARQLRRIADGPRGGATAKGG